MNRDDWNRDWPLTELPPRRWEREHPLGEFGPDPGRVTWREWALYAVLIAVPAVLLGFLLADRLFGGAR